MMSMSLQVKVTILCVLDAELVFYVQSLNAAQEKDHLDFCAQKVAELRTAIKFVSSLHQS